MASLSTTSTTSRTDGTASLVVSIDGAPVTTYALNAAGNVTISALVTDATVNVLGPTGWIQFVEDVRAWIFEVRTEVGPPVTPLNEWDNRWRLNNPKTKIIMTSKLGGGFQLVDAELTIAAAQWVFQSRAGATMTFSNFEHWYAFFHHVARDVRRFVPG